MITPQQSLQRALDGREILTDEMLFLMRMIMRGEVSPEMVAAIVIALRAKQETIGEIGAAATVMREFSIPVEGLGDASHFVDLVGTGGDATHTFNISTTAMFVTAAAGAIVTKHGNRSVSSKCGSADVLEALGMNLMLSPSQIASCIAHTGIGFMFTPNHHPAMKRLAPVRKEMGVRTIFNILGPLSNPAGAPNQLLGVYRPELVGMLVRVMQRLGSQHVLVVHGRDGMDEISLGAHTMVGELRDGKIIEYEIHPEQFNLQMANTADMRVHGIEQSRRMLLDVLANQSGPARDIVILNSGAALYAANVATSIEHGIALAREAIASGAAHHRMEQLVEFTRTCGCDPLRAA